MLPIAQLNNHLPLLTASHRTTLPRQK